MCWWWLRSPGNDSNSAAYVGTTASIHDNDGSVHDYGAFVKGDVTAVRPALWVNLES